MFALLVAVGESGGCREGEAASDAPVLHWARSM
jgi:hypothetical protein